MSDIPMTQKSNRESARVADIAAKMSEHFTDYVIIGRVKDGLVWRYSDRSFAMGAAARLQHRLNLDDHIAAQETDGHDHD